MRTSVECKKEQCARTSDHKRLVPNISAVFLPHFMSLFLQPAFFWSEIFS